MLIALVNINMYTTAIFDNCANALITAVISLSLAEIQMVQQFD
jgi:hypothetical protein